MSTGKAFMIHRVRTNGRKYVVEFKSSRWHPFWGYYTSVIYPDMTANYITENLFGEAKPFLFDSHREALEFIESRRKYGHKEEWKTVWEWWD